MAKTVLLGPGLDCRLFNDDITKVKAKAVVVSESPCLDIYSRVTQTLMDEVRMFETTRMLFNRNHSRLDLWSVEHSFLGDTFDYVIHAVINMDQNGTWVENMTKLYHRIFRKAEDLRAFTIALPLLATGKVSADHSLAIRALVASVLSYSPRERLSIIVVSKEKKTLDEAEAQFAHAPKYQNQRELLLRGGFRGPNAHQVTMLPTRKRGYGVEDGGKTDCYTGFEKKLKNSMESYTLHKQPTQYGNLGTVKVLSPKPGSSLSPDRFLASEQQKQQRYVKDLMELQKVAKRKGFTLRQTSRETDIFTSLSEQLSYALRENMEEGYLRRVVADYLRRCQSTKDNSLEDFLTGKTLAEVLFSVERGDDVDSHIVISAVSNAMNVEVLLLASSGGEIQEIVFRPFREKELLPTFVLGNISRQRFISLENLQGQVPTDIPPTWSRSSKDTELVTLRPESVEFQEVKQSFLSGIGGSLRHSVRQIKRVQSTTQWKYFNISRGEMAQRYPGMISERRLWHGTAAESINHICKDGFNRSFCGKNATKYGKGTYFSRASSYAAFDYYSVPGSDGFKYMFRARVLTGMYTKGARDMKIPPWFDEANRVRFDSAVDDVDNPTMFVTFHDTKAYPEYLIKFT